MLKVHEEIIYKFVCFKVLKVFPRKKARYNNIKVTLSHFSFPTDKDYLLVYLSFLNQFHSHQYNGCVFVVCHPPKVDYRLIQACLRCNVFPGPISLFSK